MKNKLIFALGCILTVPAFCVGPFPFSFVGHGGGGGGGGGGTGSIFASNETGAGALAITTYREQAIKSAGTLHITQIVLQLDENQANSQLKVQIWQSGAQVGADSTTVTYSAPGTFTFTFSSSVTITGDFTFRAVQVAGQPYLMVNNGDPYQNGLGYDVTGVTGTDCDFEVWST